AVSIAHVMEDCFVAVQKGELTLSSDDIDILLQGVDFLLHIAKEIPEADQETWQAQHQMQVNSMTQALSGILEQAGKSKPQAIPTKENETQQVSIQPEVEPSISLEKKPPKPPVIPSSVQDQKGEMIPQGPTKRDVRVSRDNLNRLMGLAGESLIEANWILPFADSLHKIRWNQVELSSQIDQLQELFSSLSVNQTVEGKLDSLRHQANNCYQSLAERINDLERFARRSVNLSDRLYREVIATQMRPLSDGVEGFTRMMRDLARHLDKQIQFEIIGKGTRVDRDILEKLEAPLIHLLRNAIDHGIESPEERIAAGKSPVGTIRLEAIHQAGMLMITVSDDGRGIDLEKLRRQVVRQGRVTLPMSENLTEAELMDFLFLPGFSTAESVSEISGRGVGLDVVKSMVQEVGGLVWAETKGDRGLSFHLQLPLTLSVVRALLVEISGEIYAFPLTRIDQVMQVERSEISRVENRQFITVDGENMGLVPAHLVLELPERPRRTEKEQLLVVVINVRSWDTSQRGDRYSRYGMIVDQFLGARDLVVRPLDPRLGKVQDISAAALMEDGSIVLIIDVEDLVRSTDKLLSAKGFTQVSEEEAIAPIKERSRILVVDDSITVREVERKLLENHGYSVDVAVNGVDAWNAVRTNSYDLVVTDVDMPRMNGIELVSHIKQHPQLKELPVIIVSYKDREEDYIHGLDAGANYYLTKSSFHDDTLLNAVIDLIGEF
ncbi:MAG: response regulator, partial [Cyanobacteriota bacterium]